MKKWWWIKIYSAMGAKNILLRTAVLPPLAINVMLTNCKKHDNADYMTVADLPLGVQYNEETHMYYGEITSF